MHYDRGTSRRRGAPQHSGVPDYNVQTSLFTPLHSLPVQNAPEDPFAIIILH